LRGHEVAHRTAGRHYSLEDYFAVEEASPIKHEYYDGEIYAMTGASLRHNRIARNLLTILSSRFGSTDCEAFGSDLRVRTPSGLLTYPDVTVVCGGIELSNVDRLDTLLNPTVIVEVPSESTRDYDTGEKCRLYCEIPALLEYITVDQAKMRVELISAPGSGSSRLPADWERNCYTNAAENIKLKSLGIELSMNEIYSRVDLASPDSK
jgi:Uma2 family endonuclease